MCGLRLAWVQFSILGLSRGKMMRVDVLSQLHMILQFSYCAFLHNILIFLTSILTLIFLFRIHSIDRVFGSDTRACNLDHCIVTLTRKDAGDFDA